LIIGDAIKRLGSLPLAHSPGEKFSYGLNVDVLEYLVEVISGMSLNDYFQKRIFTPLGMKDTYFYILPSKQNRLIVLQTEDNTLKLYPFNNESVVFFILSIKTLSALTNSMPAHPMAPIFQEISG